MLTKFLFLLVLVQAAIGCAPLKQRDDSTSEYPSIDFGPEDAADPATTGIFINHAALNVNNLTRSTEFYSEVFGMRLMFTYRLTRYMTVAYMAHSGGGKNGSAYQTTEELIRYKNNAGGKLELVYLNTTGKDVPGPTTMTNTFSHIGIIVPDLAAIQDRLEKYGVTIYKRTGEPMPTDGYMGNPFSFGDATELTPEDWTDIQEEMGKINYLNIFASDPDGNVLEIQPLNEPSMTG